MRIIRSFIKAGIAFAVIALFFIMWFFYYAMFYFGAYYIGDLTAEERSSVASAFMLTPEAADRVLYVRTPREEQGTAVLEVRETLQEFVYKFTDAEITDKSSFSSGLDKALSDGSPIGIEYYTDTEKYSGDEKCYLPVFRFVKTDVGYTAVVTNGAEGTSEIFRKAMKSGFIRKTKIIFGNFEAARRIKGE